MTRALKIIEAEKERDFALVSGDKDMLGLSEVDTSLHVILAR
jgi:hypothetical protein